MDRGVKRDTDADRLVGGARVIHVDPEGPKGRAGAGYPAPGLGSSSDLSPSWRQDSLTSSASGEGTSLSGPPSLLPGGWGGCGGGPAARCPRPLVAAWFCSFYDLLLPPLGTVPGFWVCTCPGVEPAASQGRVRRGIGESVQAEQMLLCLAESG